MEVDEDQWKTRDKLLLVEAVTSGAAGGGGSNGNRGDSGSGQEGKRDVNWAAVSRLLRKHIPKKRLTAPTSFGSKRCMAMYDALLARHGISAGAQGLSASNGALAEGLDRVVAALREEYMNHLRKSIALCDSEIEKSTERMTRINAGDLDEELLAHYEEEKQFRAVGQSPPAAASVVGTGASPPRKRRSLEGTGTGSPLGASAVASASPLSAGTDAPTSPLSPAQPPTKKARLEPPHAEEVTAAADTTTSSGVGHNGAPTEPPPAALEASPPAEAEAEPTKAVSEAAEPTAVESAEVGEPQGASQLESDQTLSSSVPLETPTMAAMMLGMVVEEPLPLPVVSSLSSAPASPASFAQEESWTQQPQLLPTSDDLAASLAYHDPLLVETSAPYPNADAAESVELQPQPTAAEPNSHDALEAAEPLRPAEGEIDAATAPAPTSVTEDNAPPPPLVVVSATTASEEASGAKQDSLAAPEGVKKGQPSPNAGASFSTDLLWENFETEALPTAGAGEKGDHDAVTEEATKPPPADTKAGPQGETQTEMDVEAEAASRSNRGQEEVKEEREEAAMETEKEETRRDDTKAEVAQANVEKKKEEVEEQEEQEEEEEEEPVVVEQKKPRGRPRRQSVNIAKRAYKRRKPAEAEEKEAEAEAEAKTVVVIDSDEEGVQVEDSASGEEATKKRSMKEKRGKASSQQAKQETMKVEESEEKEEEQKEAKDEEVEEESKAEKNENEEKEESEADDMEAEAEAAVRRVEMEGVRRVLATVKAHHYAKPFLQPVSVEDVPEYPNIIYRPMDFATITNRIKTGVISSKVEFLRDMYLLFQNAFIFNPKGSDIYVKASTLKTLTKTEMREVEKEVEVVRASFPPAPRPKTNPASATTKAATQPKKEATTAASRAAEANRKRRR